MILSSGYACSLSRHVAWLLPQPPDSCPVAARGGGRLSPAPRFKIRPARPRDLLPLDPPVHTIPGVTIKRGQALRSIHRGVQLAHQYRHLRSLRLKGSPAHVSALTGPSIHLGIRPVIRASSGRRPGPAALAFLLPFSRRHSL